MELTPLRNPLLNPLPTDTTVDDTGKPKGVLRDENLTIGDGDNQSTDDSNNDNRPPLVGSNPPDANKVNDADKQIGRIFAAGGETFFGDSFAIMSLFYKIAQSQRETARESRDIARQAQYAAIDTQVEKMKEAANWALAAGIASGAAQIGSGLLSMRAADAGRRELATSNTSELGKMQATTRVQLAMTNDQARGSIMEGGGTALSALFNRFGAMSSEAQKLAEKDETKAKAAIDNETEFVNNMLDIMRDTRQKLQEIANAQTESLRTIMRA
ncbi:hypothetical protein DB346_23450 [Verrucomicrobia bacterium LW23]|nr:hypothetical protein DB346_23450 [Verrucomicrobia bacterium LW23]